MRFYLLYASATILATLAFIVTDAQFSPISIGVPAAGSGGVLLNTGSHSIAENVLGIPQLSLMAQMLRSPLYADVLNMLNDPQPKTLFAPANQALTAMFIDPTQVRLAKATLLFHVVPGLLTTSSVRGLSFVPTMLSDPAFVNLGSGVTQRMQIYHDGNALQVFVGPTGDLKYTANVVVGDISCRNGVIHVIDRVLAFPRSAAETAQRGGLSEMLDKLMRHNLLGVADSTAGLTIFAPTNEAFQAFASFLHTPDGRAMGIDLNSVLRGHLVPGVLYSTALNDVGSNSATNTLTTIDGRKLRVHHDANNQLMLDGAHLVGTRKNTLIRNGVVHVIDRVLYKGAIMPPQAMASGP